MSKEEEGINGYQEADGNRLVDHRLHVRWIVRRRPCGRFHLRYAGPKEGPGNCLCDLDCWIRSPAELSECCPVDLRAYHQRIDWFVGPIYLVYLQHMLTKGSSWYHVFSGSRVPSRTFPSTNPRTNRRNPAMGYRMGYSDHVFDLIRLLQGRGSGLFPDCLGCPGYPRIRSLGSSLLLPGVAPLACRERSLGGMSERPSYLACGWRYAKCCRSGRVPGR